MVAERSDKVRRPSRQARSNDLLGSVGILAILRTSFRTICGGKVVAAGDPGGRRSRRQEIPAAVSECFTYGSL